MNLPQELLEAVEAAIQSHGIKDLAHATKKLSDRYRRGLPSSFETDVDRLAYLCTRMPATYAVMQRVFQERHTPLTSVVDFGAGLGTSLWALPQSVTLHLIEHDPGLIALGKSLTKRGTWEASDFTKLTDIPPAQVYLFSYALTEIDPKLYPSLMEKFFQSVEEEIIIIEPGTPAGFQRILALRTLFLKLGGHLLAPCPHQAACPMEGSNWCHFSERLPRTPWHRMLKEAEKGYEDEKYSYLIVSKKPFEKCQRKKRILRVPNKRRGHILFELCTEEGIQKKIISKKDKDNYKLSKKLKWGDLL